MRHQWKFLVREGFRNLGADRTLSVSSVITLGICASVLSLLLLGLYMLRAVDERYSRQSGPLRVFVAANHERPADLRALGARLRESGDFDSVVFVSKEEALVEFRRDFGEEMVRYLEVNPLPHSFHAYPSAPKDPAAGTALTGARMRELRTQLLAMPEVEEVSGNFTQLDWLDRWRAPLQTGSVLLLGVLAAALALVVHNAIKLSLYARRALVSNMKYCGASSFFIHAPFALEAVLLGLAGGLLGAIALAGQIRLGMILVPTLPRWIPSLHLALYIVGGTVIIALFSSVRTVNAFLRGKLG